MFRWYWGAIILQKATVPVKIVVDMHWKFSSCKWTKHKQNQSRHFRKKSSQKILKSLWKCACTQTIKLRTRNQTADSLSFYNINNAVKRAENWVPFSRNRTVSNSKTHPKFDTLHGLWCCKVRAALDYETLAIQKLLFSVFVNCNIKRQNFIAVTLVFFFKFCVRIVAY